MRPTSPTDSFATSKPACWLLLAGLLVSVAFTFITKSTYDTGDSIQHYLYARYAPQHPLNLLDSWAKPLFTLLLLGPAQLGLRAVMLGQCGLVAASAWLSYRVARGLAVPYAALAIGLCYAAPDYFRIQFSGLTEPLFGFVLVGSVALTVAGRPAWSAGLMSWLPFVRSEGFILLGGWAVYLAWERQWRALPWLLLGYVAYSAAGAVALGEAGWVFGRNAYPAVSPYGHGDWSTFVVGLLYLLGWVTAGLVVLGIGQLLARLAGPAERRQPRFAAELLLVYGSVGAFVLAHTLFWRFGLFGSFGLTRVLAVLTPLLAVVALRGLQVVCQLGRTPVTRRRIALGTSAAAVLFLFTGLRMSLRWQRDFGQPGDLALAEQAATWYRQLPLARRPLLVVEHPAIIRALGADEFGPGVWVIAAHKGRFQSTRLPVGTLVFWDDWFSVIEGHLALAQLTADPCFRPRWAGTALRQAGDPGGGYVQLRVFEKIR